MNTGGHYKSVFPSPSRKFYERVVLEVCEVDSCWRGSDSPVDGPCLAIDTMTKRAVVGQIEVL